MATNSVSQSKRAIAGFNLVEIAIALVIIGLLLTGGLTALQSQSENQQIRETQKILEDAREALIGYAASHSASGDSHPFLPCPDRSGGGGAGTPNDGQEDRLAGGGCVTQEGNLPWVTLGLTENTDRWGNRLRYRVTVGFSNGNAGMQLTSLGDIEVRDSTGGTQLATALPAVILSHGKNGLGAVSAASSQNSSTGIGTNEQANTDGNTTFVSRPKTDAGGTGGAFDDQLVWLTPNILFNRLIQAGRLP